MIHFNRHNTRPIALAHGAGGAIDDNFADIAHALRDEFHLFGHNYPGSGDTPADNAPLSIEEQADKLINSAFELGYSTFPVFGYSLGTTVAITAAYRRPDAVTALILLAGFPRADAQATLFSSLYASLAQEGRYKDLAHLLMLAQSPAVLGETTEPNTQVEQLAAQLNPAAQGHVPQMEAVATADVTQLLPHITVPVLVIAAGQDRIVLPESTRELARILPNSQLVELSEAGHVPTPEESRRIAKGVQGFLASVDAQR